MFIRISVDHVFVLFTEEKRKSATINLVRSPSAKSFTFRDLALATQNFNNINLIGEGGFGRVFKGRLENGQVIQPLIVYWKFRILILLKYQCSSVRRHSESQTFRSMLLSSSLSVRIYVLLICVFA
jgi:hypothetical protein